MNLAAAFGELAGAMSAAFGGPYWAAQVIEQTGGGYDDGGSWVPGMAETRPCSVQIDSATEAMRQADGYADGDVRFLMLGLDRVDTDASVEVLDGPHVGRWSVTALQRDPAAIGWSGRGRRA